MTKWNLLCSSALATVLSAGQAIPQGFDQTGFSISLGNETIAGSTPPPSVRTSNPVDHQLRQANVDVRYEGLTGEKLLNIATSDLRSTYRSGDVVPFRASMNYPAFVSRAEVRIVDLSQIGRPLVATVPINPNGSASWMMPSEGARNFGYVLRVYDAQGRFDETVSSRLLRTDTRLEAETFSPVAAGEGEDRSARRGIPVRGGTVVISGSQAPAGGSVSVMGESVPVDGQGKFVVSRILPSGDQVVDVDVNGRTLRRDVEIPTNDWFGVGIADVRAGISRGGINDSEDSYVDGRLAFYVSGQTNSGWHITSSADTQSGPIRDAFTRLNRKDPVNVIERLRADGTDLYPTYGDDSQYYDDTPTSGNIYLRAENETTRLLWGNFDAGISSGGLINNTRNLYGAELAYRSLAVTENGDARFTANLYAAQPKTAPQRDVLRGTGGSVFFLSREDITGGSTNLTVEVVDAETGFIVESLVLQEGVDYQVDHLQGVLLLTEPLSSGLSDDSLISGAGDDYDINIIAQYEYTPTDNDVSNSTTGGRLQGWVTDELRLGVIAMQEEVGTGTQEMVGADLLYRLSDSSSVQLEVAETDGPGIVRSTTTDGGLTIASSGGAASNSAQALRFRAALGFADIGLKQDGHLELYYEKKDAGFSTLTEDIAADQELLGLDLKAELTDRVDLNLSAENFERDGGEQRREAEVSLSYSINDRLSVDAGLAWLDKTSAGNPSETGERLDGAVRIAYAASETTQLYGFVQGTLQNEGGLDDNNRYGLGGSTHLSDELTFSGEVSDGDGGVATDLRLSYRPSENNEIYIGYSLDPTRNPGLDDDGRIVVGGSYRYDKRLSTYGETVLDAPGNQRSITNAYGVNYTPTNSWTLSGGIETGQIRDSVDGDFDRVAISFGGAYTPSDDLSATARLEYRTEDGAGSTRDRETYGFSGSYSNKLNDDWRLLLNAEALVSDSAEGSFHDGEYVRASLGYAYRPIDNERFNMLLRYTHVTDLPGEDQLDRNGNDESPLQRSNVLSVSTSYDLNKNLTLGGKLGYRMAEVADRGTTNFSSNTATLAALRLDWHLQNSWDVLAEGRALYTEETGTTETGALVGVYRNFGEHARIGVAYEWGNVSDDATDIEYDSQGLFLNVIGTF